jgi:CHAT domain-containing protein
MFLFLIQPVLKWIQTDHLVVIPHEDLNYVPFQTFYDGERNKYLGELFQLSYAPSATILSKLKKVKSIGSGNLLAVDSSSLIEGENEVKALGQLYSGRSKIVVDPRLKESDVKTWIGNYDLVHLSVHGRFNQAEPLLSYLVLNQGGADDGMLSTAEMFGLPLTRAQLVVLSACETGQAKATRANEIIGMQRALLYAGANSLILSSWRVDAASTELWMTTFYREAQSKPLSEASRLASIVVKNRYSHPYYWSPFLLIGK